jgi:AmiR/NasT family two-component response regulator
MMTDETGSLVAAQARAAGARACLSKPLNQGTLEHVVQCWFGTAV